MRRTHQSLPRKDRLSGPPTPPDQDGASHGEQQDSRPQRHAAAAAGRQRPRPGSRLPAAQLATKPAGLTVTGAAAPVMTGPAAPAAMTDAAQVSAGPRVLINGASGGAGTMAAQIAKAPGAEATGVRGTARTIELARPPGAGHVIDYTKQDLTQRRQRCDVILDNVPDHPPKATARVLAPNGVLIPDSIGNTSGLFAGLPEMTRAVLTGPGPATVKLVPPAVNRENPDALLRLLESGEVKVVIDQTCPLHQAAGAVTHMLEHHASGKIAITAQTATPRARRKRLAGCPRPPGKAGGHGQRDVAQPQALGRRPGRGRPANHPDQATIAHRPGHKTAKAIWGVNSRPGIHTTDPVNTAVFPDHREIPMPPFRQPGTAAPGPSADRRSTFALGQMQVRRSGYGAMQLVGPYAGD